MKKTRIFSLIALVLAMLMVFAACAPAATDNKSNDSEQTPPLILSRLRNRQRRMMPQPKPRQSP